MTEVEHYELIRREHEIRGKSIRRIAKEQGVHRRKVRRAVESALPPERKRPGRGRPVLTDSMRLVIEGWLKADEQAPRKQRHTGRRIYTRLVKEHGYTGAESTVRAYVGGLRREVGRGREVFIPRSHEPGEVGEVDWYEAKVKFPWGEEKVQFFLMRACYSGREYHRAYPRQTQQAFLEAHVQALEYFGGSFKRIRYDNLKSAVKKVLRGRRREESDRFVALRSHYLFEAEFCRPGKVGAHEKGGVENAVGRFRRNHLVPVPEFESYEALNAFVKQACAEDDKRRPQGRQQTIACAWKAEAKALRTLPKEGFETREVKRCRVDQHSRVVVKTNRYSVPVALAGRQVEVRLGAHEVEVVHQGKVVAQHIRLQGNHGERLELDHYLELLRVKPGALAQSRPLRQARDRQSWSIGWEALWTALKERHGEMEGTRKLVDVLWLCRSNASEDVEMAVELSLEYGCCDPAAIDVLLRQLQGVDRPFIPLEDLAELGAFDRPASTDMSAYDGLLGAAGFGGGEK